MFDFSNGNSFTSRKNVTPIVRAEKSSVVGSAGGVRP